ncbi:TIR domain-containing protein [Nodosilinea sp. LEGE 06152]|uniref:TIR domain-containing protein n=1 Tax=Nodosilinea sp. LEGE 06152 TaxID=2777966 RepID=UPI001881A440|nr:TIR domain-containing protein [Nodosilinea sp. LEGE 06152]MBE9157333.1 TIR domain-containing protein [Nodosilinea sp. LEGE 06152]
MDRIQLFDALSNLSSHDFERLLVSVNIPRMNRAGASAKIGEQVSALLEWADSAIGTGLEAIARHLAELNCFEFDAYLRSLVATYEKWWEHYTITDAVGKVEQAQPEQPSIFDFGLIVQTVTKEREPTDPENTPFQQDKEKTERLPVLEGIRKYADDHVLLVGRPGSGKSTALIRLLLEEAALSPGPSPKVGRGEAAQIPVLVELRYWQTSVLERIRAFLYQHDPHLNLDDAALNALLRQGRFLLLIDGLNELPSDEARTQLTTFRRDYPKVPMIFTTRDLGLGGDMGVEKKLEMQPLTEAQMKKFIRAYVPDQAEAMLRQLSDRLREFGQTPLLLWMLCEVFQRSPNRQLPTNLAEVFRAFTTMYEDSSVRKYEVALLKGDVRPLSDRRLWKEALKALAALMMQGETPVDFRVAIHRTEAERELSKLFANEKFPVRDILDDLLKYHLLQNRTTDQLEFRHQLIQEYYAAEHLLQLLPSLSDEQLKCDYINYLKWTEPIILMLSLISKEEKVLDFMLLALEVDRMLGGKLAEEFRPILRFQATGWIPETRFRKSIEVQPTDIHASFDEFCIAMDSFMRYAEDEVQDSGNIFNPKRQSLMQIEAGQTLVEKLESKDSLVRLSAAMEARKAHHIDLTSHLIDLLEDKNWDIRYVASSVLKKTSSRSSELAFLSILEVESDIDVCRCIINSISKPRFLSNLWKICMVNGSLEIAEEILDAIIVIQNGCKFYNYEIAYGLAPQGKTIFLYFSYAPADNALQIQLANHLTLLEHQSIITSWSSHKIFPGDDRTQTIHQQLNTADIILLLISPDAIADDTCYHLEIQRAIERHQSGEARVIPILLRPVDWQGAPFNQLDVLPKNHQPITTWPNPDQAFQEIAESIRTIAMEVRKKKGGE